MATRKPSRNRRSPLTWIKNRLPRIRGRGKGQAKGSTSSFKRRYRFIFTFFKFILRQYKFFLIIFLGLGIFVFARLMTKTDYFKVKEIRFEGVEQIEQEKLEEIAAKYKGKNIYSVSLSDVEKDVDALSVYIKEVYARKQLPSKLVVEITERYPRFVYIDFDGVYLVDKDNYVVAIPLEQKVSFSKEEWEAYYSQDTELEIIKQRIIANMELEEGEAEEEFDYSTVSIEEKTAVLQEIKNEINQVINAHFKDVNEQMNKTDFAGLQRIYYYGNSQYKEGDVLDNEALVYTIEALEFFDRRDDLSVTETIWESKFSLRVSTLENKTFIFGVNRDIEDQLSDLEIVLAELSTAGKSYSRIDVRAEITSVR